MDVGMVSVGVIGTVAKGLFPFDAHLLWIESGCKAPCEYCMP